MTAEQCHAFVVQAVTLAIGRDGSSGGCVRTVTVTKDGAKREFLPNTKLRLPGEAVPKPTAITASA
jgi:20S proteasome subunit beta 1